MFTAAVILMELRKPKAGRLSAPRVDGTGPPLSSPHTSLSRIRKLRIPGEHAAPNSRYTKHMPYAHQRKNPQDKTQTPSQMYESPQYMHGSDQAGLVTITTSTMRPATTTTAIVNPVLIQKRATHIDYDKKTEKYDDDTEGRSHGEGGCIGEDCPEIISPEFDNDGDHLSALQDEIAMKKEKRRQVLEQISKLEEKKRRYMRTSRQNQLHTRVARRKREKLEEMSKSKVDLRWNQVVDIEKEKVAMERKLEKLDDAGVALAMQKEEKNRCLLSTIDIAPAIYRQESEQLEERHQRESVRLHVVLGLFLALLVVLLITYASRFGIKEKSATHGSMFY